jgi:hypothetical protein
MNWRFVMSMDIDAILAHFPDSEIVDINWEPVEHRLYEQVEEMFGESADFIINKFGFGFLESFGGDMGRAVEAILDPTNDLEWMFGR